MVIFNGVSEKWPSKYCGCVTDFKFNQSLMRLPAKERINYFDRSIDKIKHDEGLDFVYGLGRLPRVFNDEL